MPREGLCERQGSAAVVCSILECTGNLALKKNFLRELFLWNVVSFRNKTWWLNFYIGSKKCQTGSVVC